MKKPKQKASVDQNPVEAIRDLGGSVGKSIAQDLVKEMPKDFLRQLLGLETRPASGQSGDLKEGEELRLKDLKKEQYIEPGIDYRREIIHAETNIRSREQQEIKVRLQEITVELRQLIGKSKELEIEFRDVAKVENIPAKPGKYHVNFVEWLLSMIQSARRRVEDAGSWLAIFKSKKANRQYWAMFKKHGTMFGLSSERVVSTQVG